MCDSPAPGDNAGVDGVHDLLILTHLAHRKVCGPCLSSTRTRFRSSGSVTVSKPSLVIHVSRHSQRGSENASLEETAILDIGFPAFVSLLGLAFQSQECSRFASYFYLS